MPDATAPAAGLVDRVRGLFAIVGREVAKFGVVGIVCFFIEIAGFNLLLATVFAGKITTAKIVSATFATVIAWLGSRYWTFRHRRSRAMHNEVLLFFVVNAIAIAVGALWLALTHYVFGMTSNLALNINNFIGIGIGTIIRFFCYRIWVFAGEHPGDPEDDELDHDLLPEELGPPL